MAVNLSPTDYNFRVCTSSTRPSVPSEGMRIYETDTNLNYQYDGSTWVPFGSKVLQVVNTQTGAVATTTTVMPWDDTIPQNTEGAQFMSLAITPISATSTLIIEVASIVSALAAGAGIVGALFQDSTAGALAGMGTYGLTGTEWQPFVFRHKMTSGTTSATTFKYRAGPSGATTLTFNGQNGARMLGGVLASSITIWEIAP